MFVKPSGPRHTAAEQGDGLAIRIPAKRNLFIVGFLTLWLCGWAFGEVSAPVAFFATARKAPGTAAFLFVWLCAWTLGGTVAIYTWLWQIRGFEVVTASFSALNIRREIFGIGRTKQYDASQVRRLRLAPVAFNPFEFRSSSSFWGIGGGVLAFDYGFKTYRFGAGLDEAEAAIILQDIAARLPPSAAGQDR